MSEWEELKDDSQFSDGYLYWIRVPSDNINGGYGGIFEYNEGKLWNAFTATEIIVKETGSGVWFKEANP